MDAKLVLDKFAIILIDLGHCELVDSDLKWHPFCPEWFFFFFWPSTRFVAVDTHMIYVEFIKALSLQQDTHFAWRRTQITLIKPLLSYELFFVNLFRCIKAWVTQNHLIRSLIDQNHQYHHSEYYIYQPIAHSYENYIHLAFVWFNLCCYE